jgi:transcriptional regulator with XRE-family HTH domain
MTVLAILRRKKGLSQAQMAELLGIARTDYSRLESGWFHRISPQVETKLKELFGSEWTLRGLLQEPKIKA